MPGMFYPYIPPDPPPPPRAPTARELSTRLADAILTRDVNAARKVFDTAFWEKVEFRPDGYHLLQAALKGDRQMVTLLASFGSTWTEDEAKLARGFIKPEQWQSVEGAAEKRGHPHAIHARRNRQGDMMTVVRWSHRSMIESKARGVTNMEQFKKGLEDLLKPMLANAGLKGDMERARDILLYRDPKYGAGTAGDPLDLSHEFDLIIEQHILSKGRTALKSSTLFLRRDLK